MSVPADVITLDVSTKPLCTSGTCCCITWSCATHQTTHEIPPRWPPPPKTPTTQCPTMHAGWLAAAPQHGNHTIPAPPSTSWIHYNTVALLALVLFVLYYGANLRARWRYRHLPGPPPRWLLGNTLPGMPGATHHMFSKWPAKYGSLYRLFLGRVPVVVVTDADLARAIAMKHFVKVCNEGGLLWFYVLLIVQSLQIADCILTCLYCRIFPSPHPRIPPPAVS